MREHTNYPKNIERNHNILQEVKKPKLYLVTSKIVNLFAVFVASISVSTFFATRYIGIGEVFFSANIFSTMVAVSFFIVILEIYGRKNAIKVFMTGCYAILLVFFMSAFITDFNPMPIGYQQTSFINFHQTVLISVFISYLLSFLACIKIYTYMTDHTDISYIWAKAIPAIAVSQMIYTISYYLIYNGFANFGLIALAINSELYLKFFMMFLSVLIIYFIISGIKSGFFDVLKNAFISKNIQYIDSYENNPIKSIYDDGEAKKEIYYNKAIPLEDYREDYNPKRNKRYLPDYSEEHKNYDPRNEYVRNNNHEENYQQKEEESLPKLRTLRRNEPNNIENHSTRNSSEKTNRKAIKRRERFSDRNFEIQEKEEQKEHYQKNANPRSNIKRGRTANNNITGTARNTKVKPKIVAINQPSNDEDNNNLKLWQQNNQIGNKQPFGNNNQFSTKTNPMMRSQSNSFGNNNSLFGNKTVQQNQQSFFANKFNSNNQSPMGRFNNMNKNNSWNKR